jgi:hypothetical protein
MSIDALINWRIQENALYPIKPRARGASLRRRMYVPPEIWEMLQGVHEDEEMEDRLGSLQADLELFVEGQPIDPKYLFLLYPARQAVWEIRSVRPAPSIRVLGLFAKKNVFVATNFAFREDLGEWQSREWKSVKRAALAGWRRLFHPYDPLESTNIQNLVTGAINGKYFK